MVLRYFCRMQLHFPYFPRDTKMISDRVGVYEKDKIVQYIVNGLPVYSHAKEEGVRESAIRYQIKMGNFKKNLNR